MITKADLSDLDILDAYELGSDSTTTFLSTSVVSTTSGTKTVVVSLPADGEGLKTSRDHPVEPKDIVTITGTSGGAGNGTFTVATVVNDTSFTVVESIGTSTGGSVSFAYPPGASGIGYFTAEQRVTTNNKVQDAITDIANQTSLSEPLMHSNIENTLTYSGSLVTQEKWVNTLTSKTVRQVDYTYTSGKVTKEVRKIFASDGTTVLAQETLDYTYTTGGRLSKETYTRDV